MKTKTLTHQETAAQRVATGLMKIGLAVKRRNWSEAGPRGLTPTQAQILSFLRSRSTSSASLGEIAEAMAITAPTASDSVSSLVGKGYVTKHRNAVDGRAVMLELSDAGRRMARVVSDWTDFLVSAVDVLDPNEQQAFLKGLIKIIRTLQVRGEIPLSEMCVTCRYFRPHAHTNRSTPHHCDFVDMAFGDGDLRLACADHEQADDDRQLAVWSKFLEMSSGHQTNPEYQMSNTGGNR
jgi:DNA-binding MarR family transcriptional regulator